MNPNTRTINAESQVGDPDSIFAHYQALIRLRKEYPVFAQGDFRALSQEDPQVLAYQRRWEDTSLVCVSNFYRKETTWQAPLDLTGYRVLLSNYPDSLPAQSWSLRPYESVLLMKE